MNPDQMPVTPEPKKSGVGALVGSIIIILILALGALYFWGGKVTKSPTSGTGAQPASDEVSNIDTDFNNLPVVNLDEDLNALNQTQ